MACSQILLDTLAKHRVEIDGGAFGPLILDVYLTCGAAGLAELRSLLSKAGFAAAYDGAAVQIVKYLLKRGAVKNLRKGLCVPILVQKMPYTVPCRRAPCPPSLRGIRR